MLIGTVLCIDYFVCQADAGFEVFIEGANSVERHMIMPLRRREVMCNPKLLGCY